MPRAQAISDVFNAIGEPRRREIVQLLARGPQAVGMLVVAIGLPQPTVSKHLGVLRKVGVVTVAKQAQQRVYSLRAERLRTVHDWVKEFESLWTQQLELIKERAEQRARELARSADSSSLRKDSHENEHRC